MMNDVFVVRGVVMIMGWGVVVVMVMWGWG